MKTGLGRGLDRSVRILRLETAHASTPEDHTSRWVVRDKDASMKWSRGQIAVGLFALTTLIGIAEGIQVYVGAHAQGSQVSWSRSFGATMPSWYVLAMLLPLAVLLARRYRLDDRGWRLALCIHLIASICFTLVHLGISSWFSDYLLLPGPGPAPFLSNLVRLFTMYFVIDTLYYWGLVAGYYAFDYSRRYRERERAATELALKASRLETSLSHANLEALRMQLNPHFLFNTLNTIAVLAMKGERQRVVRMINRLSDLLRLSLENSRQTITLGEELDFVQRYLEIEQVRFRDRLSIKLDVPEDLLDAEVPSLLLQPVVENAVLHGISQQLEGGVIEIVARRSGERLVMSVRDTGSGFPVELVRNGTGVGIGNTAARLEELYGMDQEFTRENGPDGGALVTIASPYTVLPRLTQEEVEWRRSAL